MVILKRNMKKTINYFVILVLIVLLYSCKDEELRMQRIPYTGSELRTDGYYYHQTDKYICDIIFLYRNGIIIRAFWHWDINNPIEDFEQDIIKRYNELHKSQHEWGVFQVKDDKIEYEMFTGPGLVFCGMAVYRSLGYIENDTVFSIKQILQTHSCGASPIFSTPDNKYYFRSFSQKPDSTNSWIK